MNLNTGMFASLGPEKLKFNLYFELTYGYVRCAQASYVCCSPTGRIHINWCSSNHKRNLRDSVQANLPINSIQEAHSPTNSPYLKQKFIKLLHRGSQNGFLDQGCSSTIEHKAIQKIRLSLNAILFQYTISFQIDNAAVEEENSSFTIYFSFTFQRR